MIPIFWRSHNDWESHAACNNSNFAIFKFTSMFKITGCDSSNSKLMENFTGLYCSRIKSITLYCYVLQHESSMRDDYVRQDIKSLKFSTPCALSLDRAKVRFVEYGIILKSSQWHIPIVSPKSVKSSWKERLFQVIACVNWITVWNVHAVRVIGDRGVNILYNR